MIQLTFLTVSTPMAQNISKKEIDMEKKKCTNRKPYGDR